MPSFVNDENSAIYAPNAGIVRLDDQSQPYLKPIPRLPQLIASNELNDESLDDFDNSSSSRSSDTSDLSSQMNGDVKSGVRMTMTPLPNGSKPSKGQVQGSKPTQDGQIKNAADGDTPSNKGFPLRMTSRSSSVTEDLPTENQYSANKKAPTMSTSPGFSQGQYQQPPEVPPKRTSIDSSIRFPTQQASLEPGASRTLLNGDRSPRVSTETSPQKVAQLDQPRTSPSQRASAPPQYAAPGVTPSASTSTLQPPGAGLKHRHTLEVPKAQMSRTSRESMETAFTTGRFSPTAAKPSGRRPSLGLMRRNTQSLHSEFPRDEIVPDEDAIRWSEVYRQKRAKKRREDFDDDKVLVGTKVDESHANWTTAYNMLTGIRVSVSRTNAKLDRPLTDADFETKQKSTFDIAGNELVPSAKYDFKFKDYAPWVFRHLRALFRLDPADYLMSLTGKYILSELGSPGKSGSFFYFSRDYKYIIKTIHHSEHKFLRRILKDYYNHVTDNPNTLLSQFYGLHRVKMPYGKKIHFVVMNNLFPPHRDIHQTFDLKGSTVGRDYKEEDLEANPRATMKDLNWLRRKKHLELGIQKKQLFLQQLQRDVRLLQKLQIMDYSLLVGIHDLEKGNKDELRKKTLQVFNPGGDVPPDDIDPNQVLMRTPSKLETARKARELRQMIKAERPVPMAQTGTGMPEELEEGYGRGGIFSTDEGGLRATHEDNTPGDEVYYLGVIDCLTHYGIVKKIEHFWKGLSHDRTQISALPPNEYGERFIKFMNGVTMSPEEALRDELDRQAAAVAAMDGAAREAAAGSSSDAPPAPTYLPPAPPLAGCSRSPEAISVVEKAARKAFKREKDVAKEDEVPERKITTTSPAGTAGPHAVLPVVEEAAEAGSIGGRSQNDNGSSSRPFTPSQPATRRPDGFTDLGPNGIGGRGPPTPPKSSWLGADGGFDSARKLSGSSGEGVTPKVSGSFSRESLDKALPPLPRSS